MYDVCMYDVCVCVSVEVKEKHRPVEREEEKRKVDIGEVRHSPLFCPLMRIKL